MNILQQLSETKLTKEEILEVLDLCEHAVKIYKENLDEMQNVIDVAREAQEDPDVQAVIKVTLQKDNSYESVEKTLEELIAYKQQIIDDSEESMLLLENAAKKLRLLTQIFD